MSKRYLIPAVLSLPALLAVAGGSMAPTAAGPRVRVVDLPRVIREHRQSQEEYDAIDRWQQSMEQLLNQRGEELKKRETHLEELDPTSDEYRREVDDLKVEIFKLENQGKSLQGDLERRTAEALRDAYQRSVEACQRYADDRDDVDVVFQINPAPVLGNTREKVVNEIVVREVTAYRADLDITEAVLSMLNGQ